MRVKEYNDPIEKKQGLAPFRASVLKRLDVLISVTSLLDATCSTRLDRPKKSRSDASLAWRPGIHRLASLSAIPVDAFGLRSAHRDPVMPCNAAGHPTPEKVIDASRTNLLDRQIDVIAIKGEAVC